jgi:hypothetical protein
MVLSQKPVDGKRNGQMDASLYDPSVFATEAYSTSIRRRKGGFRKLLACLADIMIINPPSYINRIINIYPKPTVGKGFVNLYPVFADRPLIGPPRAPIASSQSLAPCHHAKITR